MLYRKVSDSFFHQKYKIMLDRFSHFFFSTKVWMTSAIITPLFFLLSDPMLPPVSGIWKDPIEIIFTMIIFGGGLSIPNWVLLIIATWQLSKRGKSVRQIKTTLTIISIGLTLTLFFILIYFTHFPIRWWASLFLCFYRFCWDSILSFKKCCI